MIQNMANIKDTLAIQLDREVAMVSDGLQRALRQDARAASVEEQTRLERLTLAALLPGVRTALWGLLEHYQDAAGRRPAWAPIIRDLDLDEVAAAALRSAFSSAMKGRELVKALKAAGTHLELLYIHHGLRAQADTKRKRQALKGLTVYRKDARARAAALRAAGQEEAWPDDKLVSMGEPLHNAALSTGLFAEDVVGTGEARRIRFVLSEQGRKAVAEVEELGLLAQPIFRPMLTRPRDWEGLDTGAYVTDAVRSRVSLVRTADKAQKGLLERGLKDGSLQPVLAAVSAIQGVPLRIAGHVLALREWAWDRSLNLGDNFPLRTAVEVPEVPGEDTPAEDRRKLFANRSRALRVNEGIAPNVLAFTAGTEEARALAQEDRFYLPHSMDFRGRVYPVPSFSHHSGDATKALIEFAKGQPLGEFGLWWLAIHLANCGDFDKISKKPFWARVQWVQDNLDLIRRVATDPRESLEWTEADCPFSFYAACVDYIAAIDSGDSETYVSHVPVALDGSNSGVQHYSAALRAEEGSYVNLTHQEAPQDLYGIVAARCAKVCSRIAKAVERTLGDKDPLVLFSEVNEEITALVEPTKTGNVRLDATQRGRVEDLKARRAGLCALLWNRHGITRSTVKRPVMTFGYSAVAFGFSEQITTDFMDPLALQVLKGELPEHPFGADEGRAAAQFLGRLIYHCVCRVLPKVAEAMGWLKKVAGILADEEKGVLLITPLGFPMLQKVCEWDTKRVELTLLNRAVPVMEATSRDVVVGDSVLKRVRCSVRTQAGKHVLKHKQQSGIAPNAIHTMDACHLHMTVLALLEQDVTDFLLIHDSFATHAGSAGVLSFVVRQALADLYGSFSPLEDIRDRALKVLSPEGQQALEALGVPERGPLDLEGLMEAEYAFS